MNEHKVPPEVAWIDPLHHSTPAESLARIQALCELFPDLCSAMLAILGTHQSVPREMLAAAVKQFRRDTDAMPREDVVSLLVALGNGGRQGFEAVLRTRKSNAQRQASSLGWVKDPDA